MISTPLPPIQKLWKDLKTTLRNLYPKANGLTGHKKAHLHAMQESQGAGGFVFFQDMIHNDSDNKIFEKREKKLGEGHDEHA